MTATISSDELTAPIVTIASRFQGPPGTGNGGYVAGLLGRDGPAKVVLRRPVPVERPLSVAARDGHLYLLHEGDTVAEAMPGARPAALTVPGEAEEIQRLPGVADVADHPFPGCFVCGPLNPAGLGLVFKRIGGAVAATFVPPPDRAGVVPDEYLVGALDCTSGWSSYVPGEAGVLGTIEYALFATPEPGDRLVVTGRSTGREGRKRLARSSLYTQGGRLLGSALSTWIDIELPTGTLAVAQAGGRL